MSTIKDFIDSYQFEVGHGSYVPTDSDKAMLEDAISAFLCENQVSSATSSNEECNSLYPLWDRRNAIAVMRQGDRVLAEVWQSVSGPEFGMFRWHCKTSGKGGFESSHELAEAKCEAAFWEYEWMKATGMASETADGAGK